MITACGRSVVLLEISSIQLPTTIRISKLIGTQSARRFMNL